MTGEKITIENANIGDSLQEEGESVGSVDTNDLPSAPAKFRGPKGLNGKKADVFRAFKNGQKDGGVIAKHGENIVNNVDEYNSNSNDSGAIDSSQEINIESDKATYHTVTYETWTDGEPAGDTRSPSPHLKQFSLKQAKADSTSKAQSSPKNRLRVRDSVIIVKN